MKNTLFGLLMFAFLFCGSIHAQHGGQLNHADSLIQNHEYSSAQILLERIIANNPSKFELSKAYFLISQIYAETGDLQKARYHNQQSLSIRKDLHYEFIADNFMLFGLIEMKKGENEQALWNFFEAADLPYESIEFGGLLYAYIAQVYYRKGDMPNVFKYYKIAMQALRTAYEEGDVADVKHYRTRRNRLYYESFFIGFL